MDPTAKYSPREAWSLAVQIEEGGEAFYRRCAATADDPAMEALFLRLADDERDHAEEFRALMQRYPGGREGVGEYDRYLLELAPLRLFPDAAVALSRAEAVELARQAEKASILFYSEAGALAEDRETARIYHRLVEIERGHLGTLITLA